MIKYETRENALANMRNRGIALPFPHGMCFYYAELTEDVEMHEWNGKHPVEENTKTTLATAGTKVLVTLYSRFGDVGIRARDIEEMKYGYDARVNPNILVEWQLRVPSGLHWGW